MKNNIPFFQSLFQVIIVVFGINLPWKAGASLFDSHNNTARLIATGKTGIAATGRNVEEAFYLNPSIIASKAALEFWGSYSNGEASVGEDQRQIAFGAIDSTSGSWDPKARGQFQDFGRFPVAAALTYNKIKNDHYRDEFFTLGLAQSMSSKLAFGVSANYSILQSRIGAPDENFFDLGLGIVYQMTARLSLGLSAQNILDRRKDYGLDHSSPHLRRAVGVGSQLKVSKGIFLRADLWSTKDLENENTWVYRLGLENALTDYLHFRAGFSEDPSLKTKILGLGLSMVGPRLALHYGFQRETSTGKVLHSVDFQLPIW